jgi:hypothetical protein
LRRGATVRTILWVVMLLASGGLSAPVGAGPFVTNPLLSGSSHADAEGREWPLPAEPPAATPGWPVSADVPRPLTLDELGYPLGLPDAASGVGVGELILPTLPTAPVASSDVGRVAPWTEAPLTASGLEGNPKRLIPEPASALLFVTALAGLWARRQLLRDRNRPASTK